MTLTALIKNAILISINVVLIPTALIGLSATRCHHAPMEKVTVIIIWIVKAYCCVAMTTVQQDQLGWTVAQVMVTYVQNIPVKTAKVTAMMIQNVKAYLYADT